MRSLAVRSVLVAHAHLVCLIVMCAQTIPFNIFRRVTIELCYNCSMCIRAPPHPTHKLSGLRNSPGPNPLNLYITPKKQFKNFTKTPLSARASSDGVDTILASRMLNTYIQIFLFLFFSGLLKTRQNPKARAR